MMAMICPACPQVCFY